MIKTISIHIRNEPVYIGDYSSFTFKELFFESIALMAMFGDCKTQGDYLVKLHGSEYFYDVVDENKYLAEIDDNRFLEEQSDFPVVIDVTNGVIYGGDKSSPTIKTAPAYDDFMRAVYDGRSPAYADYLYCLALTDYYLPFDRFKPDKMFDRFKESVIWQNLCSAETRAMLESLIRPNNESDYYEAYGLYD